jgi:hypothetical protein
MNDDRQSDLFSDERETPNAGDRCRCGHARVLHVGGGSGRCDFISCNCSGFRLELAEPQPAGRDIFADALDLTREAVDQQVAAGKLADALNKPELPGFVRDSDTSRAAALGRYFKIPSQKRRIFHFIESQGDHGATCDEVEAACSGGGAGGEMRHETASSTIKTLKDAGVIVVAGERKRPTRRGFLAQVVIVPDEHRGIVEITAEDFKEPARPRRHQTTPDPPYCDGRR